MTEPLDPVREDAIRKYADAKQHTARGKIITDLLNEIDRLRKELEEARR